MPSAYQLMNQLALAVEKTSASSSHTGKLVDDYGYIVLGSGMYGFVIKHPARDDAVLKVCTNKDDGWISYALWCMKSPSTHSLRVYAMKTYDKFVIAEIELLKPHNGAVPYAMAEAALCTLPDMVKTLGSPTDLHSGNYMLRTDDTVVLTDPYSSCYKPIAIERYTLADGRIDVTIEQYKETPNAGLATSSEVHPIRAAYEDQVLRAGQLVSSGARNKRLPGVVLPVRSARPRKVRSARFEIGGGAICNPLGNYIIEEAEFYRVSGRRTGNYAPECAEVAARRRRDAERWAELCRPLVAGIKPGVHTNIREYLDGAKRDIATVCIEGLEAQIPTKVEE